MSGDVPLAMITLGNKDDNGNYEDDGKMISQLTDPELAGLFQKGSDFVMGISYGYTYAYRTYLFN